MTDTGKRPVDPLELGADTVPYGRKRLERGDVSGGDRFMPLAAEEPGKPRQRERGPGHAVHQKNLHPIGRVIPSNWNERRWL